MMKNFWILAACMLLSCAGGGGKTTDPATSLAYVKKGDSIVSLTSDSLRNTLMRQISNSGLEGALRYCNVNAFKITNALASRGISIERVSDRPRNIDNEMSERDHLIWAEYKNKFAKADSLRPALISEKKEFHFYKPIFIQPLCLSCHGPSKTGIPEMLLPLLDSLYPEDKARSYKSGDLRGMWHVTFRKPAEKNQ